MLPILPRLKSALAGRYDVERELGTGGMATVFLARDVRHDRPVAIKVLNPILFAGGSARRFLTEVHVTANLQHPNILPLHDSGEVEGLVYYVMPYVEGESLRLRLARGGPLPLAEALPVLEEVADALACAHERGIVHRDIKPENILLSRDHALVADFGVAKAADIPDEISTVTGEGLAVGTPAYMAPEQAIGQSGTGPRADLYALGLLAFETITGRHPFDATTPTGMIAAHLSTPAPRLSSRIRECPPALDDLVAKLLAKKPAERPADAAEVRKALRDIARGDTRRPRGKLTATLVGVIILAAAIIWARQNRPAGPSGPEVASGPRSLAVLPLTRIGGDSTDDYFGDGIADELISTLGRLPGLRVASRTSSFALKGRTSDLREIGGRLGVQTILEGSVQRSENRIRVIARLVDVGSDTQLWSGTYDGTASDIFAMQDSVVRAIAGALQTSLAANVAASKSQGNADPVAHDLYLRGRHFLGRRTPSSLALAVQYFNDAIARDSSYADAWAGLATAWAMTAPFAGGEPRQVFPRARVAADRALALDSTAANAHTARAVIAMFYEWDLKLARAEFDRSLALNPSDAEAHLFYHWLESMEGRSAAARERIETAAKLDPLSVIVTMRVGTLAWFQGRYADAEASIRKALQFDSTFHMARSELSLVLLESGKREAARGVLPPADEVMPGSVESAFPALVRVALGDTAGARRTQATVDRIASTRYVATDLRAMLAMAVGDVNGALDLLERALDERAFTLIFIGIYPPWRALRNEPRFKNLLAKLGLPPMA